MRETSTARLIGWSRSFPATPGQAGKARRFLAAILDGHPADDAILCLSELVTNATIHSRSAQPGGCLTVRVQRRDAHVRVEACDQGGPWTETAHEDGQAGRGLLIVDRLARTWGRRGNAGTGWITWFELDPCS
jgi:anti-sigma regulatory factor (Ser/Thr protein kinase)